MDLNIQNLTEYEHWFCPSSSKTYKPFSPYDLCKEPFGVSYQMIYQENSTKISFQVVFPVSNRAGSQNLPENLMALNPPHSPNILQSINQFWKKKPQHKQQVPKSDSSKTDITK